MKMISRAFSEPGYETKQRTPLCTSRISCRPNEERRSVSAAAQAVPQHAGRQDCAICLRQSCPGPQHAKRKQNFHPGSFSCSPTGGASERECGSTAVIRHAGQQRLRHMTLPFVTWAEHATTKTKFSPGEFFLSPAGGASERECGSLAVIRHAGQQVAPYDLASSCPGLNTPNKKKFSPGSFSHPLEEPELEERRSESANVSFQHKTQNFPFSTNSYPWNKRFPCTGERGCDCHTKKTSNDQESTTPNHAPTSALVLVHISGVNQQDVP
jgi:hypothetical protein